MKQASKPHVGMKADEVLKMAGRSAEHAGWPRVVERDGAGRVHAIEWVYEDVVVLLRHDGKVFRVVEVRDVGE